ncbi:MAG: ATP-dependent DNA helicase [Gammaproteobacteria bacterium]|nr:ATP-dependent DNA helicase [Gammaproteobacteria bacterium]
MPSELLGAAGPFQRLPHFAPRAVQQALADAVAETLDNNNVLVAEAGTGVGKTFAYLVPALSSGLRIIISTATRHLQDQLFHRDLPNVKRMLGVSVDAAQLKGRANYICLQRLEMPTLGRDTAEETAQLSTIRKWLPLTQQGDIAELESIPEAASIWPRVTSTAENCLGSECPRFNDCFVVKARRRAQEANIVVINHHLLFADMALKEEGFGEVLPSAQAFILDEAHRLPEIASHFFGSSLSTRQFSEWTNDIVAAQLKDAPDAGELRDHAQQAMTAMRDFRLSFGAEEQRGYWQSPAKGAQADALLRWQNALQTLDDSLQAFSERSEALQKCASRSDAYLQSLAAFNAPAIDAVQWWETTRQGITLHQTPLEIGEIFKNHRERYQAAWILTSATLSVAGDFRHFNARMGLQEPRCESFDSPFDYPQQGLLYVPEALPEPNDPTFSDAFIEAIVPVIEASQGRAFVLFTSHRALNYAARVLAKRIDFPLFVQGEMPRGQLLDAFRDAGNGVLLGTASFWEGVDIRGEALSLVIIDKLPFAAPGDPVLQARLEAIRRKGGDPFNQYQLPQTAITLKQGAGRLIRDVHDSGVLMLCDVRLVQKGYGKRLLAALPPFRRTRSLTQVTQFFAKLSNETVSV